jgi:hypothetical protein
MATQFNELLYSESLCQRLQCWPFADIRSICYALPDPLRDRSRAGLLSKMLQNGVGYEHLGVEHLEQLCKFANLPTEPSDKKKLVGLLKQQDRFNASACQSPTTESKAPQRVRSASTGTPESYTHYLICMNVGGNNKIMNNRPSPEVIGNNLKKIFERYIDSEGSPPSLLLLQEFKWVDENTRKGAHHIRTMLQSAGLNDSDWPWERTRNTAGKPSSKDSSCIVFYNTKVFELTDRKYPLQEFGAFHQKRRFSLAKLKLRENSSLQMLVCSLHGFRSNNPFKIAQREYSVTPAHQACREFILEVIQNCLADSCMNGVHMHLTSSIARQNP